MMAACAPLATRLARGSVIKVCGLRQPEHAAAAAAAGADLLGFIFAPARRQVSAATARACIAAARQAAGERVVFAVGVFVDAAADDVAAAAVAAGLDVVQLHGAETPDFAERLRVPAIKALRPRPSALASEVVSEIAQFGAARVPPAGFLLDGFAEGSLGGSGARADWLLATTINAVQPVLLAGGLRPENVGEAIRAVRPLGVDVSSGVELDGIKRPALIEDFVRMARQAFTSL